jgi:hypothetical protein
MDLTNVIIISAYCKCYHSQRKIVLHVWPKEHSASIYIPTTICDEDNKKGYYH